MEISGKFANAVIYTDLVEDGAIKQVMDLCNNAASNGSVIRIMPDVHEGNGCTIGTTMTIHDRVTPNLVGVDIACGMRVVKLAESEVDFPLLDAQIKRSVPSGFNSRTSIHEMAKDFPIESLKCYEKIKCGSKSLYQLGTLGGGNHFIEVNKGTDCLYLVIHSGSRNVGKLVAEYYQDLAYETNLQTACKQRQVIIESCNINRQTDKIQEQLNEVIPANKDLAYLMGSEMQDYLHDCDIMAQYASLSREIMAHEILRNAKLTEVESFETVHNYVCGQSKDYMLRKGAISAHNGEKVIIPMNMRDGSIIAVGKGNQDWNCSAPHGAGRVMGRREAKRTFKLEDFQESMQGIYTTSVSQNTIDESPFVYKPMEEITKYIGDTVDIIEIVKPVYNFKDGGR
jgi:RNA-splicing ligase RtcB